MYRFFCFSAILLLFTSCGDKKYAYNYFDKTKKQERAIQDTRKIDIMQDNEPKVIFWLTYLNNVQEIKKDREVFLINVYFVNSLKQDINEDNFEFRLNGKPLLSIEKIEQNNEKYRDYIVKNRWGSYYILEFDKIDSFDNLDLNITAKNFQGNKLEFRR